MTPAEKLGYKVGDKFEVISEKGSGGFANVGMIVEMIDDDRTDIPKFKAVSGDTSLSICDSGERFISLDLIKPLDKPVELLDTKAILKKYIEVKYPSDTFLQFLVENS